MKNKSKKNKIKQSAQVSKLNLPEGWLYMTDHKTEPREIAQCLENNGYKIELWPELNILEVIVEDKASIDIELGVLPFGDEYSDKFVSDKSIQSLYYISFPDVIYDKVQDIVKVMKKELGGALYGDTADFTPVI